MTHSISLVRKRLHVKTKYDPGLVAALKQIDPRREWDTENKCWKFPAEPIVIAQLCSLLGMRQDELPSEVRSIYSVPDAKRPEVPDRAIDALRSMWPGESVPYRHQLIGWHLLRDDSAFALFWEMGCGKSAPVAARIAEGLASGWRRVLILCPKSALTVWPHELRLHGGIDRSTVSVITGNAFAREKVRRSLAKILVTNYEVARIDLEHLRYAGFDCIVCDESHRIKTMNSQTAKAVRKIAHEINHRYALSGTPAPNSPIDVCGTLSFLDSDVLGTESITALRARYCVMGGFNAHQVVGYRNLDDLERKTQSISQRLKKTDCLDLPPKIFETRAVQLSREQSRIYRQLKEDAIARIETARGNKTLTVANVLTESLRLLQVCGGLIPDDDGNMNVINPNPKIEMLSDILEDISGEQVIIWANFREEVRMIAALLHGKSSVHHGQLTQAERTAALESFKRGDNQYLVSTPQSAREAITLTNAATVIYYSRGWNLLDWSQSQDRAHRIGQTRPVVILSLVADGTVDARIGEALARKESLQELVVSGRELF